MSTNMGNQPPGYAENPKANAKAAKAYAKASRPWYKKKRFWLIGLIVLIIIIAAASSGGGDTDDTGTDTDSGSSSDAGTDTDSGSSGDSGGDSGGDSAVKVTAKELLKAFEDNEAAADGKYSDKTLEITGKVSKVDTEIFDDEEYVVQVGTGGDFDFLTVNCDDQSADDVSSLGKGDDIVVVGDFEDGGDLGVELENCKIS